MSDAERGRRYVRVEDLATTVRLKRVQAKADAAKARERARIEAATRKVEARARAEVARMEVRRLRLQMSSREAAKRHLAHFAGLYLLICVLAFLYAVQVLEGEVIGTVTGLITLVVTSIASLLKAIVSENGGDTDHAEDDATPQDTTEKRGGV